MLIGRAYPSLAALPASYDSLFNAGERESFSFSRVWFENVARAALAERRRVRAFAAESLAQLPLALLLFTHVEPPTGLRRTGTLYALRNDYSSLFGPIISPSADPFAALQSIVAAIASERCWDTIDLRPLSRDTTTFAALREAFLEGRFFVQEYFCFGNWYLDVRGRSFEQYEATLPSALRNTIHRKERQLRSRGPVRLQLTTNELGLVDALESYERVYRASWKPREGSPDFLRAVAFDLARRGWLRLGILNVASRPVAAQIWIVAHGTAAIFKLAHDEAFSDASVGSQLTLAMLQQVIDVDGVVEVDYLTGDDAYKRNWMSGRRERWGIRAFNRRLPVGLFNAAVNIGGAAAKRTLRRLAVNSHQRASSRA